MACDAGRSLRCRSSLLRCYHGAMRAVITVAFLATSCGAESQPTSTPAPPRPPPPDDLRIAVSIGIGSPDTTLTPDVVLAKIQTTYSHGILHCYADRGGRVDVELAVDETGHSDGTARGIDDVDECITAQISSWRFPYPKDSDWPLRRLATSFRVTLQIDEHTRMLERMSATAASQGE